MHITLTEQQEVWVQNLIQKGHYASTSEVLRHAIRLLQQEAEAREATLIALRESVSKGADEIRQGKFSNKNVGQIISEAKKQKK